MKKGFTLIELLAVIVILAVIALIATPVIMNAISLGQDIAYKNNEYAMTDAAVRYLAANDTLVPKGTSSVFIKLSSLVGENYLKNIFDPKSKTICDTTYSGVKVTNDGLDNYTWTPYLNCDNYKGDNTSPTIRTSISGNNLTVISDDSNFLSFDGYNDYAYASTTIPENLTIEAWVYDNGGSARMIWSFKNSGYSGPDLMTSFYGGKLYLNTGDSYLNPFSTSVHQKTQEWHHYAVVFNKAENKATLYIDGIDNGTATYKNPSGNHLFIGSWFNISNTWFGYIRDVRVWSTQRSQSEIVNNMYSNLSGNETGLISYFKMSEMEGTKLIDLGSNKVDATIYGATWRKNSGVKEIRIKQNTTLIATSNESVHTFALPSGTYTVEVEDYAGRITTTSVTI